MHEHAGRVPLILKLNGKTNIADDAEAVSPAFASVEDAVRLGADAVGYTVYVGSPRQDVEIREYGRVRQECERFGMPLVVWAYPRGRDIEAKGGKGSLYAQDYAARVAEELGADVVKLHEPRRGPRREPGALPLAARGRRRRGCGASCAPPGKVMVLFSGGVKQDDDAAVLRKVKLYMECGATGVMFGRNMWLRDRRGARPDAAGARAPARHPR